MDFEIVGDFLGGLDRARVSQPAEVAPVALLQQCENGSTVPAVGVVEQRLHLREPLLVLNGGISKRRGRSYSRPLWSDMFHRSQSKQ